MDSFNITDLWILTFRGFIETALIHKVLHVIQTSGVNRTYAKPMGTLVYFLGQYGQWSEGRRKQRALRAKVKLKSGQI